MDVNSKAANTQDFDWDENVSNPRRVKFLFFIFRLSKNISSVRNKKKY